MYIFFYIYYFVRVSHTWTALGLLVIFLFSHLQALETTLYSENREYIVVVVTVVPSRRSRQPPSVKGRRASSVQRKIPSHLNHLDKAHPRLCEREEDFSITPSIASAYSPFSLSLSLSQNRFHFSAKKPLDGQFP